MGRQAFKRESRERKIMRREMESHELRPEQNGVSRVCFPFIGRVWVGGLGVHRVSNPNSTFLARFELRSRD